jgi:hypothetical protein
VSERVGHNPQYGQSEDEISSVAGARGKNARVMQQGTLGTPAFRRNILGAGTIVALTILMGFACLMTPGYTLFALGFVCFGGTLFSTWVFIPLLLLHQREKKGRQSRA